MLPSQGGTRRRSSSPQNAKQFSRSRVQRRGEGLMEVGRSAMAEAATTRGTQYIRQNSADFILVPVSERWGF